MGQDGGQRLRRIDRQRAARFAGVCTAQIGAPVEIGYLAGDCNLLRGAIDRANINPPKKVKEKPDGFIYLDVDMSARPFPIGVQGVLSIKEQDIETGGFSGSPLSISAL